MDCFLIVTYMWLIGSVSTFPRIFAGALTGAAGSCMVIMNGNGMIISFCIGIISSCMIILVLYCRRIYINLPKMLYMIGMWYFNAFAMGGVLNYIIGGKVTTIILVRTGAAVLTIMYMLAGRNRIGKVRNNNKNMYHVTVSRNGKKMRGYGYYDSGCMIREPISGEPAILSSYKFIYPCLSEGERTYIEMFPMIPDEWDGKTYIRSIPYHSIGNSKGHLPGIMAENIVLECQKDKKTFGPCYIAVYDGKISSDNSYDFILHCDMRLGG